MLLYIFKQYANFLRRRIDFDVDNFEKSSLVLFSIFSRSSGHFLLIHLIGTITATSHKPHNGYVRRYWCFWSGSNGNCCNETIYWEFDTGFGFMSNTKCMKHCNSIISLQPGTLIWLILNPDYFRFSMIYANATFQLFPASTWSQNTKFAYAQLNLFQSVLYYFWRIFSFFLL